MGALEDAGFYCIDNLPPVLLPKFLELCTASSANISRIAMVMDVRERAFLKEYPSIFKELKEKGQELTIIFLESTDEILVRRYKETRRQHPWQKKEPLWKAYKRSGRCSPTCACLPMRSLTPPP